MNHRNISELEAVWPALSKEEGKGLKECSDSPNRCGISCDLPEKYRSAKTPQSWFAGDLWRVSVPNKKELLKGERNITVTLRKKGGNWIIETMQ